MSSISAPRRSLYRGKFLELAAVGHWEFVDRIHGAMPVGIVARTPAGALLLLSQFRVPVGKVVIEIPAGMVGDREKDANETWQDAANRELREETGYAADHFEELMQGPTSAGLTSECIRLVWARNATRVGDPTPDGDEQITAHEVPLADVERFLAAQVAAGCLVDPKVYAALYFVEHRP